jgi:hypothetical protein
MAGINQFMIVKRNTHFVCDPILEVRSRDCGSPPDLQSLFPHLTYVSLDMGESKGG